MKKALERAGGDQNVALLGLGNLPKQVKVDPEGAMVTLSLHLSAAQYSDLFTRLAGVIVAVAQQEQERKATLTPAASDGAKGGAKPKKKKPARDDLAPRE
jgi:hypothetical protein